MNRYVIKATGPLGWRRYESCEIGVSIGNPNHTGDKLRSILQWANKRFPVCIVTLSDTLGRHSLMCKGMDEANAYFKTRKMGDEWLQDNDETLNMFPKDRLVLNRWDRWLKHPEYETISKCLEEFRIKDTGFSQAMEKDSHCYLKRLAKRGETFDHGSAFQNCLAFFTEELSCYILIGRAYRSLRAYPARDMACFQYMRDSKNIPENLKGLEQAPHIELNFKKKIWDRHTEQRRTA